MKFLSWEEMIQKYIIKHSDQIRRVTQPLRDHFGIGYFTYHRIDNQGKYTVLLDRPDWAEHYVGEKFFLADPYLRKPEVYQSGLCLLDTHADPERYQMLIDAGIKILDMDMGLTLIQKNEDGVEFFGFAGRKSHAAFQKLYLNNPQILSSFAAHFRREFEPLLQKMGQEANNLYDLKGDDYLCDQPITPLIDSSTRLAFLSDLGMENEIEKLARLSGREGECLSLLLQDKISKEIAAILGLSPRTIEFYFDNIKTKLGCYIKQELLSFAKTFQGLGLL